MLTLFSCIPCDRLGNKDLRPSASPKLRKHPRSMNQLKSLQQQEVLRMLQTSPKPQIHPRPT